MATKLHGRIETREQRSPKRDLSWVREVLDVLDDRHCYGKSVWFMPNETLSRRWRHAVIPGGHEPISVSAYSSSEEIATMTPHHDLPHWHGVTVSASEYLLLVDPPSAAIVRTTGRPVRVGPPPDFIRPVITHAAPRSDQPEAQLALSSEPGGGPDAELRVDSRPVSPVRIAVASSLATAISVVGATLLGIAIAGAQEPNPYIALMLLLGGVVLWLTVTVSLRSSRTAHGA